MGKNIEAEVGRLMAELTLDEKINQMSGDTPLLTSLWRSRRGYIPVLLTAGESLRQGIPALIFTDGPRGVVQGRSTCFPCSMARGASWDVELEEAIGEAMGIEARSQGANLIGAPCINILRHPAWGRSQETYGEDPYHIGELGAAMVRGIQRHAMACAKHFAANSIENSRFTIDVSLDERALNEIYLPHFKRCVEQGVASVMSAYNRVNGAYCAHNIHLLRQVLKGEWGFQGFVVSDFTFGTRNAKAAALGGLDLEMPAADHFGKRLKRSVKTGEVPESVIDESVKRLLGQKLRFSQVGEEDLYTSKSIASEKHRMLARKAAQKSIVLLKNQPVDSNGSLLPIAAGSTVAVIGWLAATPNTGDRASSHVQPPYVITPLEGIRAMAGSKLVHYDDGRRIERAAKVAHQAGITIVVVGYTYRDEGEFIFFRGGDRRSLTLHPHDEALIQAVAAANPRIVVILMGGGPIITEAWRERIPAILMAWYPGMEGGHAIADVLFGQVNPSAKLPCSFPRSENQLPFFKSKIDKIEYDLFHGYRLMDRNGEQAAFPFGFGLSYTHFDYRDLRVESDEIGSKENLQVSVLVTNSGTRAGDEVVQLYAGCLDSRVVRAVRELKGFARISLNPGETKLVSFTLPASSMAYYYPAQRSWIVEPASYRLEVGSSSAPEHLLNTRFNIHE